MIPRQLIGFLTQGALALILGTSVAHAAEFRSATFRREDPLEKYIEFPDGADDILVVIPCRAQVTWGGRIDEPTCFYKEDIAIPFVRAILRVLHKPRLRPAATDSEAKDVMAYFSVRFARFRGETNISVRMNHGASAALYGPEYIDAQMLWNVVVPRTAGCDQATAEQQVRVLVEKDGKVGKAQPVGRYGPDCQYRLNERTKYWRMIPATLNEKPVDSFYWHLLYHDGSRMRKIGN